MKLELGLLIIPNPYTIPNFTTYQDRGTSNGRIVKPLLTCDFRRPITDLSTIVKPFTFWVWMAILITCIALSIVFMVISCVWRESLSKDGILLMVISPWLAVSDQFWSNRDKKAVR